MKCYRFCSASDEKTMYSNLGKKFGKSPGKKTAELSDAQIKRAASHMDGSVENSPFVSLFIDVSALKKFGHSGGLKDIIFGVDDETVKAPNIVEFDIPDEYIVDVAAIKARVPATATLIGLARAYVETEVLIFGDDLASYKKGVTQNFNTAADYRKLVG